MSNVVRAHDPVADRHGLIWPEEGPRSEGLGAYLDVVRARALIVVLVTMVSVFVAAVFVSRSEKVYEAKADILVTPIPRVNTNLYGLGLVSESGEPTRDAETLAQLITTPEVAQRVRSQLRVDRTPASLLAAVKAQPVAQSSIVTVSARANDPRLAARIADAFGRAAIDVRTERLHALLDDLLPRLRQQLESVPATETRSREEISGRVRDLEALRLLPDPTLHFETRAAIPTSAVAPRPLVSIAAAFVGGLILAIVGILIAHVLDTRVERESDLRRYGIPILARIPRQPRQLGRGGPLLPGRLSATTGDAFHRFASTLVADASGGEKSLFVTSPGTHDGKTTTSLNLAGALAALNESVVLVDADSRRPTLGSVLSKMPTHGLADVVLGRASLPAALVRDSRLPHGVSVLAQTTDDSTTIPIPAETADRLVREATARGRWLVFDGPALNFAPETLPLARRTNAVVVVARIRATRTRDLADLVDLLQQQRIVPTGFVVVGGRTRRAYLPRAARTGTAAS